MENKFDFIHLIGRVLRIIGAAELVIAAASLVLVPLALAGSDAFIAQIFPAIAVPGSGMVGGVIAGLVIFVVGVAAGLLTISVGELFKLMLAIEENTRTLVRLQMDK